MGGFACVVPTLANKENGRADVSEPASVSAGIAARYATALFDLSKEGKTIKALEGDIDALGAALDASADLRACLSEAAAYLATLPRDGVAEIRAGLAQWMDGPVTPFAPRPNAVIDTHLAPALAQLAPTHPALAAAIGAAAPHLPWITYDLYPVEQIGPDFGRAHAYVSLVGEEAVIRAKGFDFGLFLIAPHVLYRDHRHAAAELYMPLTGPHGWRFGPDQPVAIRPAHVPVWNPSLQPHMTKVGAVPFLCFFGWTGDVAAPAEVLPATDWPALEALRLG